MDNENVKINFFKKTWYSIGRISKYDDMIEEGIGTAIKYFIVLVVLLSFIFGILFAILEIPRVNEVRNTLNNILPEIKISDGKLSIDSEEEVVLDNYIVNEYLNSIVVFNPYIEKEQAIDKYSNYVTKKYKCEVFLKDEVLYIPSLYSKENNIRTYKYNRYITLYDGEYIASKDYVKSDIAYILTKGNKATVVNNVIIYIVGYLMLVIPFLVYILAISISTTLMYKILKMKEKYSKILATSIYASTLPIIIYTIYLIAASLAKFIIPLFNILIILIMNIYVCIHVIKKKKLNNK